MKVVYWWWKLSIDESCLLMNVVYWWKLSSDGSCLLMKVIIVKEVISCDVLPVAMFTSLNHQLFKNIECVGYFWHFVIGCICVFANLYFCICVFDSNKCNFWFPWTQAFQKYNICWVYWHFVIFCIWVFVYLWIFICEYDSP